MFEGNNSSLLFKQSQINIFKFHDVLRKYPAIPVSGMGTVILNCFNIWDSESHTTKAAVFNYTPTPAKITGADKILFTTLQIFETRTAKTKKYHD